MNTRLQPRNYVETTGVTIMINSRFNYTIDFVSADVDKKKKQLLYITLLVTLDTCWGISFTIEDQFESGENVCRHNDWCNMTDIIDKDDSDHEFLGFYSCQVYWWLSYKF